MKKVILLLIIALTFFFNVSPVCSKDKAKDKTKDKVTVELKGEGIWEMFDEEKASLGRIEKTGEQTDIKGAFRLYDKRGGYVGLILSSKRLRPKLARKKTTTISLDDARAYVNAMEVLDDIK
jgi:hypothetical protein